jgi:hypothetical protein
MSHVHWVSLVTPVVVAAVTTLVIEYLAKPSLEARKQQILETHEQRRATIRGLRRAAHLTGLMVGWRQAQANEGLRNRAQADEMARDCIARLAAEAELLVAAAIAELGVPAKLRADLHERITTVDAFVLTIERGDVRPDEKVRNYFGAAAEQLECYAARAGRRRCGP